jgi:hypothetical protein
MPHYLIAVQLPDNFNPATQDQATINAINDLNEEAIAAGARVLAAGLSPASQAKSLRWQPSGDVLITDGPYLEAKEHVGGFWIMQAADMDEALAWGRKGAIAGKGAIEIREIPYSSLPNATPHPSRVKQ